MPHRPARFGTPRRAAFVVALLLLLPIANGCNFSLSRPHPDRNLYTIDVPMPEAHREATRTDAVLRVHRLNIAAPYDQQALGWRVGPDQHQRLFFEIFAAAPDRLLTSQAHRYLQAAGPFSTVIEGSSLVHAGYALEGRVLRFIGDRTDAASPKAVIEVHFLLTDESTGDSAVITQKVYQVEEPLPDTTPAALVAGLGHAWGSILNELSSDLAAALSAQTQ